jgi:hypothetical protein
LAPTASGKTNLAFYLKEPLPIDLISVDSSLVYKKRFRYYPHPYNDDHLARERRTARSARQNGWNGVVIKIKAVKLA